MAAEGCLSSKYASYERALPLASRTEKGTR